MKSLPQLVSHPGTGALVAIDGTYPKLAVNYGNLLIYRQKAGTAMRHKAHSQTDRQMIPGRSSPISFAQLRAIS